MMSEEFSVRKNQEKKSNMGNPGPDASGLNTYAGTGEAAWGLPEPDAEPESASQKAADKQEEAPAFPILPGFGDEEEETQAGPGIDIMRLLRGVWERRKLVAMIAAGITLFFAGLAFMLLQHSWKAQVSIIKREHADLFRIGQFSEPFKPQKYNLNTMLDTLKLPSVLVETIRRSDIDITPRKLAKQVDVIVGKNSNIFRVVVEWEDPKGAANIVNHLADAFIEKNRMMRRADAQEAFSSYSAQLLTSQTGFDTVNAEILAFQNRNGIINFDSQTKVDLTKLADIEVEYQRMLAEIEAMQDTAVHIDKTLAETPKLIVQSSYYRNPLKKKLAGLKWELVQARGRYTDKNPKVIDLQERIRKIQHLIENGADDASPENTYAANPVRQELQLRRYRLEDQLRLKNTLAASLKKTIAVERGKLASMNTKQKQFFQLSARLEVARRLQDNLRNRVEDAHVIMLRDESDFGIVERATPPDEPESSGRKIIIIAGAVLGVGAALFIALLLEFLDPSIRTRRETLGLVETDLVFEFQHVPDLDQDIIDIHHSNEPVAITFRRIINDMQAQFEEREWQSLAIVSAENRAGRSMIATNLVQAFALKERPAFVIDADLSADAGDRPGDLFELGDEKPGLLQVLTGGVSLRGALQPTDSKGVYVMPASNKPVLTCDAVLNLGRKRMTALISSLSGYRGHVFYDLPALTMHETAFEATTAIGHALLVLRSGQSKKHEVKRIVERLKAASVEINAVILTDVPADLMQTNLQFVRQDESQEEDATEGAPSDAGA